jgi:soluble lytic murein transglycosylase
MRRILANIRTLPQVNRANTSLPAFASRALALLLSLALILGSTADVFAQNPQHKKKKPTHPKSPACETGCRPETTVPALDADTPEDAALQKELAPLARDLRHATPGAYEKMVAFANKNAASSAWGKRAALALGFAEFATLHQQQALNWLEKAKGDALLEEYVLFYTAQSEHALGKNAASYEHFTALLNDYPHTVIKEQVLEGFLPVAIAAGHAQEGLDALDAYPLTSSHTALLLARARAYESTRKLVLAAKDYQAIFYRHPFADEATDAGQALHHLNAQLHSEFPYAGVELQDLRAQAFFDAHKWKEARVEYEKLASMLKDPEKPVRQRALVRAAECRQHPKASPYLLAKIAVTDPETNAERLYYLSQAYRSERNEPDMLSAIEQVVEKYPESRWSEDALMAAGNYYWVNLDRADAGHYYERVLEHYPGGKNAYAAEWRIAWIAYMDRQPYADEKISVFLRKYPVSGASVNALYWLGRDAERGGNPGRARAYYRKAVERFPSSYFGMAAQARLEKLGPGEDDSVDYLAQIPPAAALRPFDEPIAPTVLEHWNRAQALRTIAFDASAELELKAAYAATASPRFLIEAAQAAFDQGHFASGMNYARQAIPSFDSRKFSEVPAQIWKVLFPLPYESVLRREAERNGFDPMFAAGLIRQESTFQADAVSHANAIGLMQILPKEGRRLAKERKVRYTRTTLFDPNMNIELGMVYISDLTRTTGAPEYAAAAYNAGEDRLAQWRGERNYEEICEFVESIPITETREYVQIVLRNATMYRLLYAEPNKSTVSASVPSAHNNPSR